MLVLKNVRIAYGSKIAINNLNLELANSMVYGLVGLNGSGKTTLLNAIYGSHRLEQGQISYNDKPLSRETIAYLPSENFFYSNISGIEYLNLFNTSNLSFSVDQWNNLFGLPLNQEVKSYSLGMKKKLAILGTLKQDRPIIILDEPFNGLDLESTQLLLQILVKLKESGKMVILTSHILQTLTATCDIIHYLVNGNILFSRSPDMFDNLASDIFDLKGMNENIPL